ncbi:nucleoside 2-deoxyribosyltransferase [Klebsiella sp. JB_Kp045]|uniref:nucleoside 2-deoxyribosyltransferase n=1 Tax=Klebsiella TaxID=570 RepID=UPI000B0E3C2C|nr:nucleoside 2-deoxyribosyltransferase [Klebsiella quasipneumoniae]HDU4902618.1 nucleoside 2-deoxyribosyltransferase [Klebsiella quasipneumoniae subsp. similipneumoniae]EIY5095917.1 nucleoside 2-deoxyribosyltransferase [Klebsiella quasipneumoniae]MCD7089675.1 nucleoside 2-deoxyribosyltransferase [Klebsiella quasipneumoniae subsp. quasipneumoniae]MCU8814425.1 nucleoside 2-deoxyribosyltransferase [Klebsiella quasipneumoniae]MDS0532033.1 nucleoside 2-deoxyribosyltransferase [Klebsiella quasipneu
MVAKKNIYLAAPLFNEAELSYNRELREYLEPEFNVFLPQEDGLLLREVVAESTSLDVAEKKIFEADIMAMNNADIILAILNGAHIDEGVAFELGYCFAAGKRCIGLKEDIRQALPTGNNPMISKSCERIFDNKHALLAWLML